MSSAFAEILAELVGSIPGAIGAVFLDWEGEAVDQFAHVPTMDILLEGAHWGVVLRMVHGLTRKHGWGDVKMILLQGHGHEIIIRPVTREYCVVLTMRSGTHTASALEALERITERILEEM